MKELMTLVDKNDNIIWYKERWTLDYKNDIYRISALRLENSQWEVLIAQRSFKKKNQPWIRWPAVSGTVNDQETYEQNILKEAQEEIWLELTNYKVWIKEFIHATNNNNRKYFRQRFTTVCDKNIDEFILQEEEVEAVRRISKENLQKEVKQHPENFTATASEYIKLFCQQ